MFLIKFSFTFAQNVDLTSVDEFFKITDKLRNEEVIDEEQWSQFENSAAYSVFSKAKDRRVINIAKSSMKNIFANYEVKERLNENDLLETMVLANYEDVNRNYHDIKSFRDSYDFERLVDNAKLRLQSFLRCESFDSTIKWKPVYYWFLSKDGKDMPEAVLIDFNLIYKMNETQRIDFLAHEFFHVYRTHFENHDFNYANDINFALDMIQNEGIADQIDKFMGYEQYYFSSVDFDSQVAEELVTLYDNAENDIEYLQDVVMQYVNNQIDMDVCVDKILEIYKYNGHALGFYMSNQIVKAGFKEEMIKEFYNPYRFFELYSLALHKNKGTSLNSDFLTWLKDAYGLF